MIWVRETPQEIPVKRSGISRIFNLLIFQTGFFGAVIFAVLILFASMHPAPGWLPVALVIALIGFAGGILGAFIAFGLLSSRETAEE